MEWQKVLGFLGKKDKAAGRDAASTQYSQRSFEKAYGAWLIEKCKHLTDVPIAPVNGFPELTDLYCQPSLTHLQSALGSVLGSVLDIETTNTSQNLNDAIAQHKQLLIVAPSGYGKTTLCRYLALRAASFKSNFEEETLAYFIPLKVLNQSQHLDATENELSTESILKLALPEHLATAKQAQTFAEEKLKSSKCLFLFDGLDEIVNDDLRQKSFLAIEEFAKKHTEHYVVLTSSQQGVPEHVKGVPEDVNSNSVFTSYSLLPLNKVDIRNFVNKHFDYLRKCIEIDQNLTPQNFIQKIEANPKLAELCQNPMLLCMSLALYTDKVVLETEQAALFESYLKQSLLWYTPQGCHPSHWQIALERIAYTMHKNAAPSIQSNWCKRILMSEFDTLNQALTPDELDRLLLACRSQRSIFKANMHTMDDVVDVYENIVLEFSHKSFQDFLTAKQLHHKGQEGLTNIKANGLKTWDQDMLVFYVMLAKGTVVKADELIYWLLGADTVMNSNTTNVNTGKKEALFFASDLALQSNTVSSIVVERIQDNLESLKSFDDDHSNIEIGQVLRKLATKYKIDREVLLTRS